MRKVNRNAKGFALVELTIILVMLVALGGVAAYTYHRTHNAKKASTGSSSGNTSKQSTGSKTTTTVDPYAGWTTEKVAGTDLMFKHPAGWTLQDVAQCDGAHSYTVDAPSSEVQQSGLTGASNYGLAITVNAEASGTSKCAPSVSSRAGIVLGSQSHSEQVGNGALKGKYVVANGSSDGAIGIDVLDAAYGPGQKITETGLISASGLGLQVTSSFSSGQNPASVNVDSFLNSQIYKDTINIVNSLATN
jgi:Tfp pilus assembly protein PilE